VEKYVGRKVSCTQGKQLKLKVLRVKSLNSVVMSSFGLHVQNRRIPWALILNMLLLHGRFAVIHSCYLDGIFLLLVICNLSVKLGICYSLSDVKENETFKIELCCCA